MRIAFITPEYVHEGFPDGGLANYLARVCSLLRQRALEPVVFLLGEEDREFEVEGIQVIEVARTRQTLWWLPGQLKPTERFLVGRRDARNMATAFYREHGQRPFNIIQSASYGALGGALVQAAPVPIVVRVSSYAPFLRAANGRERKFSDHLLDWLEVRQILRADAVFTPSQLMSDILYRYEGVCARVIRSPFFSQQIDCDDSLYDDHLRGKPYLLFFGTMCRLKGVDVLAEALPVVFAAHPDIHMVFVGRDDGLPGGQTCTQFIRHKTESWPDQVHLFGRRRKEELVPLIRNARAVVLPSRIDNYPNTCLEAQEWGRIVIATRDSSLDEMVRDGETGFLADAESPDSLAHAIMRALSISDVQRQRMDGLIGELREERNTDKSVQELVDFYQETIRSFDRQK